jgi:hypothetical protein
MGLARSSSLAFKSRVKPLEIEAAQAGSLELYSNATRDFLWSLEIDHLLYYSLYGIFCTLLCEDYVYVTEGS